ncbi:MAG: AMP-binding protein [Pygmaiobacter massiliensis]|nr:AMP-binding protein [Pygmaiobacter massiliensis]
MEYEALPDQILSVAKRVPEQLCYQFSNQTLTYRDLSEKAQTLAAYLGPGSAVMLHGHKSPFLLIGMLACLICGRTYLFCDCSVPPQRAVYMLGQSGADFILCEEAQEWFPQNIAILTSHKLNLLPVCAASCAKQGSPLAYFTFTSGSTGSPKGIRILRRNLWNFIQYAKNLPGVALHAKETSAGHALFSFDLSVADLFLSLTSGATFFAWDKPQSGPVRLLTCTPTYLKMCLMDPCFGPDALPFLQTVICCGETLPCHTAAKLFERFPGICLYNAYGPAECCCFVSAYRVTLQDAANTAGKGLPIAKAHQTASEIICRNGELFIQGNSVGAGYLDEITGGFQDGGFYTKDAGFWEDDRLYFTGRLDRMVKYAGFRIEPAEIEAELLKIPGVYGCFVLADRTLNGEALLLRAEVVADPRLTRVKIRHLLAQKLPSYMIPKVIHLCDHLPVTEHYKAR